MKLALIIFLLLSLLLSIQLHAEDDLYFTNLGIRDGLSQLSVMDCLEDSRGRIWFGTRNGLNCYDGSSIKVFKSSDDSINSLVDNDIRILLEDHNFNLWIGTSHGLTKMSMLDGSTENFDNKKYPALSITSHSLYHSKYHNKLFIGTSQGVYFYDYKTHQIGKMSISKDIDNSTVTSIAEGPSGSIFFAVEEKGILSFDKNLHFLKLFLGNISQLRGMTLWNKDSHYLWVMTRENGLIKMDFATGEYVSYTTANSVLSSNNIRDIASLGNKLYIGTFNGLYYLDLVTDKITRCESGNKGNGGLRNFSVYSLCADRSGGLWVGTYSGGASYFHWVNNRFKLVRPADKLRDIVGIYGSLVEKDGNLYISTEGSGILEYDIDKNSFSNILVDKSGNPSHNIIKSISIAGNSLLCGTAEGKIFEINPNSKTVKQVFDYGTNTSVYSIVKDEDDNMYVTSSRPVYGFSKIDARGNINTDFLLSDNRKLETFSGRNILKVGKGRMLIGTSSDGVIYYDENLKKSTKYSTKGKGSNYLPANYITSIIRTRNNDIWISTFGGGLSQLDLEKGIVKSITDIKKLKNKNITSIIEDNNGMLWCSSLGYITQINPKNDSITSYSLAGIGIQEFTPHSAVKLSNGKIVFSCSDGLVSFDPNDVSENTYCGPIILSDLKINNETINPSKNGILKDLLNETKSISLTYKQGNIVISFCQAAFLDGALSQYAYRLKGHDKNWNYVGNRHDAYFTNLSPGKYVFEVKCANNDGIWSNEIRSLQITITPPIWATWYAYLFYILLFIGTSVIIGYWIIRHKTLEHALEYEHLTQQKQAEFHEAKVRMFTNFSHELRTPLTLILAPLMELTKREDLDLKVADKLKIVKSNAERLMVLVNQLMDLRRSEAGKTRLQVSKDELCMFIKEIYLAFNQIAINKHISLEFDSNADQAMVWFDKTILEKVSFNLISNALKYTPIGGHITIRLDIQRLCDMPADVKKHIQAENDERTYCLFSVEDDGYGVPEENVSELFSLFFRAENTAVNSEVGTGIGLNLTKSLIELHHGTIWYQRGKEKGSIFSSLLPVEKDEFTEDEIDQETQSRDMIDILPSDSSNDIITTERTHTVLIVEDNTELRDYLRDALRPYFITLEASNGQEAFDIALEQYPNLILSDVMMPVKDGLELCKDIKSDMRTEHIPVILLTARSLIIQIKEGFSIGADDYIVKPFNLDVLIYRIYNIITSREKLKNIYGKRFSPEAIGIDIVSSKDKFTQKFFEIVEKNICNSELDIDFICSEIGMSRSNFYRKLKAITNLSPMELIRNKRLEVAAKLLQNSEYSIAEITYTVGFNSQAYFSQCFKQLYGCTPSEFQAQSKSSAK